jgi:acid stress-induced BolA-like protein IbaG/YrbA
VQQANVQSVQPVIAVHLQRHQVLVHGQVLHLNVVLVNKKF